VGKTGKNTNKTRTNTSGRATLTGEKVKKSGGLEKARVHWHTEAYANKLRADGHVETILPERGVLRKRQNRRGQHHHP
jgi:hypothetical protein